MKRTILLLWLFLFLTTTTAQEFEPPVIIDPPHPQIGDIVRVGLFTTFFPPCLILPRENQQGQTHLFDFDTDLPEYGENHIDLIVIASNLPLCNSFPVTPAPREFYELGILEEGEYTLRTGLVGELTPLPLPPNVTPFAYGEVITFSVTRPLVIDSISNYGLMLLTILFLVLTLFFLNKKENFIFRR